MNSEHFIALEDVTLIGEAKTVKCRKGGGKGSRTKINRIIFRTMQTQKKPRRACISRDKKISPMNKKAKEGWPAPSQL